eukprot:153642-Prymnesium_polylepis.2
MQDHKGSGWSSRHGTNGGANDWAARPQLATRPTQGVACELCGGAPGVKPGATQVEVCQSGQALGELLTDLAE